MQSTEKQKHAMRFGLVFGKGAVLATLAVIVTGCVVDPSPRGYYQSYPNDYAYRDYSQPYYYPGSSVALELNDNDRHDSDRRDRPNYDRPDRDHNKPAARTNNYVRNNNAGPRNETRSNEDQGTHDKRNSRRNNDDYDGGHEDNDNDNEGHRH